MIAGMLEDGQASRYMDVYFPRQPKCLPCYNIPEDGVLLDCNTSHITYIIELHLDVSVCIAQVLKHIVSCDSP